jgi:acetylornithine deacetylase/succinyl-diaminopimelate desuccinylase-like protein
MSEKYGFDVRAALAELATPEATADLVALTIAIQQIPAPTFGEAERAAFVQQQFEAAGLAAVEQDALHNVYGRLAGKSADTPPLVLSAHTDTVFPADTDLTVRHADGRIYAPGIGDNSAGVAGIITLAALLRRHALVPDHDIWFVANVCEEGLGDLRGMRAVVDRFPHAGGFVVVEGGMFGRLLHRAIGVRRYEISVETAGGHSWNNFGTPSAIHAAATLIDRISRIAVPANPRTTFNVGTISGGTSVNTIAARASFLLDLRSEDEAELTRLADQVAALVAGMQRDGVKVVAAEIGNRPPGTLSADHPLVRRAVAALHAVGCHTIQYENGSTDANVPLSRNLPAVCIGLTRSGNAHRLDEYLDPTDFGRGMQQLLLLAWGG